MENDRFAHCPLETSMNCPYKTRVSRKRRSSSITRLILGTVNYYDTLDMEN
jgi:hypothetical protein